MGLVGPRKGRSAAIRGQLLHHATTVNIKSESYRLKEKGKAGLLGKRRAPTPKAQEDETATETVPADIVE